MRDGVQQARAELSPTGAKDYANKTRDLLAKRLDIKSEIATDPEKWEFRLPEEERQAVEEDLRAAKILFEPKK